eukprot:12419122-Ditylum_brightwellii.AAC.1
MMKISLMNIKRVNQTTANKLVPITFFMMKKGKLSPSDYQVYKLSTNPKDMKSVLYLLAVGIY